MPTKIIGIKEFRANISDFAKKARKKEARYIIMNRTTPLFEIKPFSENDSLEKIFSEIILAKEDVKKGRVYSQDEILKKFA